MSSRTIVITGASEGIGEELALQLAERGTNLVLAARNKERLDALARCCQDKGARALVLPTDVSKQAECRRLIDQAVAQFGGIDILVNSAGISMNAPFEGIRELAIFERLMQVNYLGTVWCTHAALPHLRARRGLLVALSSLQGLTGFPLSTGYSASKHAVQGFCDSLRIELLGSGVAVLVVSPGPVDTAIHARKFGREGVLKQDAGAARPRGMMSVEECARQMVKAIRRRDRALVMTAQGKLIPWFRLIAPGLLDRVLNRLVRAFHDKQKGAL